MPVSDTDRRMMAAAIRLAYRHLGRTGTNPSVSTLIVREFDGVPVIIGRGITALGGRPHAETQAIAEAGDLARGATAYVSLEPCAHHGSTPPCAEGLIAAGIKRVVSATTDPDDRVSGRGYAMLREAGIEVEENVLAEQAEQGLAGYLTHRMFNRPNVSLKMALSRDGKIGRRGVGQVHITGPVSQAMTHLWRASADAILVGIGTAVEDDPSLTCRLPGLQDRSPARIVLDSHLRLPLDSKLVQTAREVPVMIATSVAPDAPAYMALAEAGCQMIASDTVPTGLALPELLDDLANRGISSIMVEGGATTAKSFIEAGLVDSISLFEGPVTVGADGVVAPVTPNTIPEGFGLVRSAQYGDDVLRVYERTKPCSQE